LPPALRGRIDLWVRKRGRIPDDPVDLKIEEWRETPTGMPNPGCAGKFQYPRLLHCETVTVRDGMGSYRLHPHEGSGLRAYRIVPSGVWPECMSGKDFGELQGQEFYFDVRVLPFDDYSHVTDDELTFDFVYKEVLRYYHLILPAMSKRLDLSDATIWSTPTAAQYVLRMTDPGMWACFNYMPRTRDLSKYRRDLLRRFCENVVKAGGIVTPGRPAFHT
jgi:hypothetical protein